MDGGTKEKLEKLNGLIKQGGEPIGFVGLRLEKSEDGYVKSVKVYTRLLDEHAEEEWAQMFLARLVTQLQLSLEYGKPVTECPGWIQ